MTTFEEDGPDLWNIKEVAHYLRVHVTTMRRWIASGKFPKPTITIYHTHRWRAEDVKKFRKEAFGM